MWSSEQSNHLRDNYGGRVNFGELVQELLRSVDAFSNLTVAEYKPLIERKAIFGLSRLRDTTEVTGTGSFSVTGGEIIQESPDSSSSAYLETNRVGQYVSGVVGIPGQGIRVITEPQNSDDYIEWGYGDGNDGFGFGIDFDSGLYYFVKSGGTYRKIQYRANWIDPLDGTGPSKLNYDVKNGGVYRTPYVYYGYGSIVFNVMINTPTGDDVITVGVESFDNSISIENANLPLFSNVVGQGSIAIGGRHYGIYGTETPEYRFVAEERGGLSINDTDWTIAQAFRLKNENAPYKSINIAPDGVEIETDASCKWALFLFFNTTLTGFSEASLISSSETATEWKTDGTNTISTEDYELLTMGTAVASSQGNSTGESKQTLPIIDVPKNATVALALQTWPGTTGTVHTVLRAKEDW